MWYETKEAAEEACIEKEKIYNRKFFPVSERTRLGKDLFETQIWWTKRGGELPY